MNVFKSLGKLIWGDANNPELVQISSGQFYVYKGTSPVKRTKECIYIDSMATIRRTSQPFQYTLAINRVFEEGEETLQDDEQDDLEDEKIFLIDQAIKFRKGVSAGATTFSWQGLSPEDAGLEYEFVCDDETTVFTANNFEITVYQCMYERKHQKSHFSAEEEAIMEFHIISPGAGASSSTEIKKQQRTSVKKEKASTAKQEQEQEQEQEEMQGIDKPALRDIPTQYDGVAEAVGELNLFDPKTNLFMSQADNVRCQLLRTDKFTYWLVVLDSNGKQQLAQPVEPRMNPVFSTNHRSFIWNYFDEQHNVYSWLIRFPSEAALKEFQGVFAECMYEALNQQSWEKVPAVDQEYMIKTYQDVEMTDSEHEESDEDQEEEVYSDEEEDDDNDEYDDDEDEEDEQEPDSFQNDTAMNSQLAVGYKDRSFVVRGNKIGVFKHNDRDGLDFSTTIKNVSNSKGREINPSRVVLHEQDTAMVMVDPRDLDTAYKMDLEYGKVVEEWHMPGTTGVLNLVGDSKYSHLTDSKTMVGHSSTAMFRVDPRLSGSKIAGTEFKQYARGNNFTCITTTDNGSVAMAGSKGDIKLFNSIGKNSKTALPGLGDPIIGIDVTGNGRYVIATCKAYLMLIDVLSQDSKKLGFDASFPAKDKPKCIKLHLKPEHVAAMKQAVSFTPARFNTGVNEEEKTIVTSTGPYVITWNFRRVKNGHYEYQIKQYPDNVVADNFKFGQDRSIIVALPHDVTALPRRTMASPADAFKAVKREKQTMSHVKSLVSNAILLSLFPSIGPLRDYLEENLDERRALVHDNDSAAYKKLLVSTLVATNRSSTALSANARESWPSAVSSFPRRSPANPEGNQDEVRQLLVSRYPTILTVSIHPHHSYVASDCGRSHRIDMSQDAKLSRQAPHQQAKHHFPNTLEEFVRSEIWWTLLRRIGDAAMLYLLRETSMFVALPNNCYCQITGPAISEQDLLAKPLQRNLLSSLSSRKRSMSASESFSACTSSALPVRVSLPASSNSTLSFTTSLDILSAKSKPHQRPLKRMKRATSTDATVKVITPAAILFKRSKIFYVKRYHTESTMLRHFLLSNHGSSDSPYSISASQLASSTDSQIVRMFPRQYGLENVFVLNKAALNDGKKTSRMHPWRLREMRHLVENMLELNIKCKYTMLLQHYCPVKPIDNPTEATDISAAALLQCHSSFDQVQHAELVLRDQMSHEIVTSFVHSVVKKVIPLGMFGTLENRAVILRAMTRFIRLRKFETLSLQYVLHGFKMSACQWLEDTRISNPRTQPTASVKKHEILQEFLYWLFEGFLIPLLRSAFYITDSSFQRNKIFYYRHGLWHLIARPAVNAIQDRMFVKMQQEEVETCNRVYGRVRLLPKEYDLRPIINLRKKSPRLVNGSPAWGIKSTNQQLAKAFLVLAYERSRQIPLQISSSIGMSDLFQHFKQVKNKLVCTGQSDRLYMVKVDIKKAFDSINQDKLIEIIDRTLKEDQYMIHRHSKLLPSNGKIMKRFLPKAVAPNEMSSFLDFARSQAEISKHAVLVDKVVHSFESKVAVMELIKDHVRENIVKFGRHFYRQTIGIPQGSILSPALCRFFYDEMVKDALSDLTQQDDCALLRLADDFLFISQSRDKAVAFLQTMSDGHPEYGCFINDRKTVVNFDVSINGKLVQTCLGNEIVLGIFRACFGLLHNSRRSVVGISAGVQFKVAERHVHWLGATAFCRTLPSVPIYAPLKSLLRQQILGPLARDEKLHFKRMLHSVIEDPRNEIMDPIKYQ
ncbi:hypothetical protein EDD11_001356 [Mortierella claussenii]|nr:hypothetical protein EDD11_001356 [Mortierella claussenii]